MKTAVAPVRIAWAVLVALLLAVHSLAPAGFMPAFNRGTVTIIGCPDAAGGTAPMPMAGGRHHNLPHQTCPYAAVSPAGSLGAGADALLPIAASGLDLLIGPALIPAEPPPIRERPPVRGPPNPT